MAYITLGKGGVESKSKKSTDFRLFETRQDNIQTELLSCIEAIQPYTATTNKQSNERLPLMLVHDMVLPEDLRGGNSMSSSAQCSRALAISNNAYGITLSNSNNNDAVSNSEIEFSSWVQWSTALGSNIASIKSTENGNIIAASTMNGSVSLLRGCDGGVLLNKSISSQASSDGSGDAIAAFSHSIDFVQNTLQHDSNEMLMIYNLQSESDVGNSNRNMDMILVSNIDGNGLNSNDAAVVKASSKFSIDGIKFTLDDSDSLNAVVVKACLMREHVVRFIIGHVNGTISVHEYNTVEKKMFLVNKCVVQGIVDVEKGLHIDVSNLDDPFILVSVRKDSHVALCWYSLHSLLCVREYLIPKDANITALCPLKPCFGNSVAAAFSMEMNSDSIGKVVILQGVLNHAHYDESSMDTDDVSKVKSTDNKIHQVYSIDLGPGSRIKSLVDGLRNDFDEYRVQYCVHTSDSTMSFKEFCSGKSSIIAKVRLLLAQNRFEDAEECMSAASKESLSTPYGSIHSSEVVLARFLVLLRNPKMLSGESKDQVKECLRRLSFGAVSGGSCGVRSLVLASKNLSSWDTSSDTTEPYIRDYRLALSVMAMSISNAIKGVSAKYVDRLKEEMCILETKASVLKTIEIIVGPSGKPKVQLSPPLLHVKNHNELYQLLIERGAFRAAEIIRKSEIGINTITPKVLVDSVQGISIYIDPKKYCAWLKNAVFPSLTIQHRLLESVLAWGCKTADAFDENGSFGIDASILLLETIESAVNKLNVDSHGSFALYSPFDDDKTGSEAVLPTQIDVNTSMGSSNSRDSYRSRNNSILHSAIKNPASIIETVLVEGNQFFQSIFNTKLSHARIIKKARIAGLPVTSLQLSRFEVNGGSDYAAKELIRIFFTNSWSDYLSDNSEEKRKVQEFCEFAQIKFDTAIQSFSKELCSQGYTDPSILSRANDLVASCSTPDVKCEITLRFLHTAQMAVTKPPSLKALAREALSWATSEETVSELEEATRLLGIDEILRKYCGKQSVEVFRVADPIHSVRLVEYVAKKVNCPNALSDVLYLCSAFTHLSTLQYCSTFVERLVASSLPPQISRYGMVLKEIYKVDAKLGESVAVRACNFCADIINSINNDMFTETENDRQNRHESVCIAAIEICRNASMLSPMATFLRLQKALAPVKGINLWSELMIEFQRLLDLQKDFNITLTLWQLRERSKHDTLMNSLIKDSVESIDVNSERLCDILKLNLGKGRRGCALLFGSDEASVITSRWCKGIGHNSCKLVASGKEDMGILLLETSGVLDEIHNATAYQAVVMVVLSLCSRASASSTDSTDDNNDNQRRSMMNIILANSLLQDHALVFCPSSLVPMMVFLSNLVDVATQMILRSDSGVGEEMQALKQRLFDKSRKRQQPLLFLDTNPRNVNEVDISLHRSWHTGDGLLLPPRQAIFECMTYCKELLSPLAGKNQSNLLGVHKFLGDRGVHSISLRLLTNASVVTTSAHFKSSLFNKHVEILGETLLKLSERCLGGSGTGNTNGRIDHQMAVPLLLSLHMKVAFKAFKRCLPSALSRRDFDRVNILANVGLRAAGATSSFDIEKAQQSLGWKNQINFVLQCRALAEKAYWWRVLQCLGVRFNPSSFDDVQESTKESGTEYIKSLIPDLIRCASQVISNRKTVQLLACYFCKAFKVDPKLAPQNHIAFLLSMPSIEVQRSDYIGRTKPDIRISNLALCSAAIRELLDKLPNKICRSAILRKCLRSFEEVDNNGTEFDRYGMLLSLYQSELLGMLSVQSKANSVQSMCLQQEIERVDRRQDALAILSSFYSDSKAEFRPCIQRCFVPLPKILEIDDGPPEKKHVGILGDRGNYGNLFDPIIPLLQCLQDPSHSVISALAPICISLGVPSGSIHARALIERIVVAKTLGGSLPPFEAEVLPVLKRLKFANDGAELTEWCASQYPVHSQERLLCLDMGLDLAMKASTQAEQSVLASRKKDSKELVDNEKAALERVERMTSAKSVLSDIITVKRVLDNAMEHVKDASTNSILSVLIGKARTSTHEENIPPEQFVENLLIESSLASAEGAFDEFISLPMTHLCRIASTVHSACKALEDQYSHIDVGRISRSLVRRWLLHGDEGQTQAADKSVPIEGKQIVDESFDCSVEDDDTMDFVLDLNIAAGQAVWNDVGSAEPKLKRLKTMTADEEQSSIKATTARETSEFLCTRTALRVAFVMSFAEGFHPENDDNLNEENLDPNQTRDCFGCFLEDNTRKHAKYLLSLVFSKDKHKCDEVGESVRSGLGNGSVNTKRVAASEAKALTFAMRHRSLRAASALCPEGVIHEIVAEEGFLRGEKCTLSMCCFGVFVAKEIEAMGLALPHSDLIQLSMMHKPSYARTLWRHCGKSTKQEHRGRLMLLMLELALKDGIVVDSQLVASILQEIIAFNLPRTNLLVCECMAHAVLTNVGEIWSLLMKVMKNLTKSVLHDVLIQTDHHHNDQKSSSTIQRVGSLMVNFIRNGISQKEIEVLMTSLTRVGSLCTNQTLRCRIVEVVASIIREVKNDTIGQDECLQRLRVSFSGDDICSEIAIAIGVSQTYESESFSSRDCLGRIMKMEHEFNVSLSQVLFTRGLEFTEGS